jgi:hypothetical protein
MKLQLTCFYSFQLLPASLIVIWCCPDNDVDINVVSSKGGNGIGLSRTYWGVVVRGFLIALFPDAQALVPAGAVVVAAAAAAAAAAVVKTTSTTEQSRFCVRRALTRRYSTPPSTTMTSTTMMTTASRMVAVLPPMPAC